MAESGEIPGLDGFLVPIPACEVQAPPEAVDCMVVDEENGKDLKKKGRAIGKGRARDQSMEGDVGDQMNDITNSRQFFFFLLVAYIYSSL